MENGNWKMGRKGVSAVTMSGGDSQKRGGEKLTTEFTEKNDSVFRLRAAISGKEFPFPCSQQFAEVAHDVISLFEFFQILIFY